MQNKYTEGQLLSLKNLVVEVCAVEVGGQCSRCAGFNKKALLLRI